MRFIGNKELITVEIENLLENKGLINHNFTLFDAFCGTGAVSDYFKDTFRLKINDLLNWSGLYAKGRVCSSRCKFETLGFDPFEYLNSSDGFIEGFFFSNYSPGNSSRMYFSAENAGRIDFFRQTIEEWKDSSLIDEYEYSYLVASLIESISFVSNTAGVYGAFLKHWDPRAKKPIILYPVESKNTEFIDIQFYNDKIENIIENVDCDILYLDPR